MMHEEKLSGDEPEVGQRAVPQHQQHLIGCQPAAGGVAPATPRVNAESAISLECYK